MKLHPGDIVEIQTPGGLAYVQVTHNHASYPEVVRALPGLHESRPADLGALAQSPSLFTAMLPLGGAIEKKRVKGSMIGSAAIPDRYKTFPTFRMPIRDKRGGTTYWWLWDGESLRYETDLDAQAAEFPMREVMSLDAFLEKFT